MISSRRFLRLTHIGPWLVLLFVAALGGCAGNEKQPEPVATPEPAVKPPPAVVRTEPRPKKPGPIPVRPLNVKAECAFRDETGYNGAMRLAIDEARVQSFEAKVTIPRHGACRFDLKDFRQTREMPSVELAHLRDRCIVRVWEQGERVTVAFQQCQRMCSGNAHDYLWPILTDTRDGSCA